MIPHPFALFEPFANRIEIAMVTKENGNETEEEVMDAMGAHAMASVWQIHGGKAVVIRENSRSEIKADALATDASNLLLTIRQADCQTFVIYSPEAHVAALVHAGWRGLIAGILPSTFDLLWEEWGIRAEDVVVGAGPSLCQTCAEFTDPVKELPGIERRFFDDRHVDLRGIADDQLWKIGVREGRFERHPDCTACLSQTYWTYRGGDRDAVRKGSRNLLAFRLLPPCTP
jgi:YfiH family protein